MISKRIHCKPGNDNYGRLASYIADASHQGEKALASWCAGCWAGDDYALAMQEVADTQALNTRSKGSKTYHLIVSFRPEDEALLDVEKLKEIERRFAEALGLSEHQRHCGVHVNTENMHMHVAYNLIHPERLTRVEPWQDYFKRDKLCRKLEKEFDLVLDNGLDKSTGRSLGNKAAGVEAHTGLQSFESHVRGLGEKLLMDVQQAKSWEDVHAVFARQGLLLQPRGAGLIIKNRHGRQTAKASAAHRELSMKHLAARFGAYRTPEHDLPESMARYGQKPLQKGPKASSFGRNISSKSGSRKKVLRLSARNGQTTVRVWKSRSWRGKPEPNCSSCPEFTSNRRLMPGVQNALPTGWNSCARKPGLETRLPWLSCVRARRRCRWKKAPRKRRGKAGILPASAASWRIAHCPKRPKTGSWAWR